MNPPSEEGKKNPERRFTGAGLPPLVFRKEGKIFLGRGLPLGGLNPPTKYGIWKLFPKAHFEPTGLVFPEEENNPEREFARGVNPPVFPETERNLDRQRGSRLSNCSNGGRRKKIMARGVGGRGDIYT